MLLSNFGGGSISMTAGKSVVSAITLPLPLNATSLPQMILILFWAS